MLNIDINLLFTVVNVLILYAAVRKFLWKPVHEILARRQAQADGVLAEAEEVRAEAQQLLEQRKAELAGVREEEARISAEAYKRAAEDSARILADARSEAEEIRRAAGEQAKREKADMMAEVQHRLEDSLLTAAARAVAGTDDSALYDSFLEKAGADSEQ